MHLCAFVPSWLIVNLKKQSQFSKGQNDVKSVITMEYGKDDNWRRRENKPNSKPNKANRWALAGNPKQVRPSLPSLWLI